MALERVAIAPNVRVTKLCVGSLTVSPMQASLPAERASDVLAYAFDRGITFTDTAQYYENYGLIRRALEKCSRPDDVVISSKTYAYSRELAEAAVEEARRELDRDVIDIFMLHEQESYETLRGHMEALDYLFECKSRGIVKAVGASMHHIAAVRGVRTLAERGIKLDVIHPIFNKAGIGIADGTVQEMAEAIKNVRSLGVGVFGMKSLAGGHLYSSAEEAFRFVLDSGLVDSVAVGMQSEDEIDANISFFENGAFTESAKASLASKKRSLLIEDFCVGCGSCVARCAQGALRLEGGRAEADPDRCVLCAYCSKVCPMFAIKVI
ncbi:MAG: aldo/keto reductase [Clostridia bacterium]|nr:aldo/keto reductase [Clostridia bacterium]